MKKRTNSPTSGTHTKTSKPVADNANLGIGDAAEHTFEHSDFDDDAESDELHDHAENWLEEYVASLENKPKSDGNPSDKDVDENGYTGPSRSQLKREAEALLALGAKLLEQPQSRVDQMMMPPYLEQAIKDARRARGNGGKKRALQFVGKMMRRAELEDLLGDIRKHMALIEQGKTADTERLHAIESLRQRLLEDEQYLTPFMQSYPQADAQQIRTLIRNARKEKESQKPPKSSRELFQLLKTLVQE